MATETARPTSAPDVTRSSPALVVTTLALCGIVVSLQQTLLLPLLPELPRLLDTSVDNASWLVTATLLAGAIATPTLSRLADMYGKRRMMLVALGVSVAGSILGALSTILPLLIAARALQGVGMALIPIGIATMRDELPRDKLPLGVALMSATLAIGAGVGLPLSGLISEHLDWHAIFWLTGAVGVALVVAVVRVLPESPVRTRGSFDLRGALLLSAALTAVLVALSKGAQWGWLSPTTLLSAAIGLALLAVWAPLELRTPNPLVDIRVATRRAVLLANVGSMLAGFGLFANMLVTTQQMQQPEATGYGLGLDVLATGLWMAPGAVAFALMAPVSAWLIRKAGPQVTLIAGALVMGVAYVGRVAFSDDVVQIAVGAVVVSAGTAMTYAAFPTLITRAVPVTETASANGLNVLLRAVGTSTASATIAAVTTFGTVQVAGVAYPSWTALASVYWLAAGASFAVALLGVPMLRMTEYRDDAIEPAFEGDRQQQRVVHGRVVTEHDEPVRHAVVTVMTPEGESVDWGQADTDGQFAAAVPSEGDYLVVASIEGRRPQARLVRLTADEPVTMVLGERVTLTGTITGPEGPCAGALVVLTRGNGEVVGTTRTDGAGEYALQRPANGRYVLTAVAPDGTTASRTATVFEARAIDLTLTHC